MASLVQREWVLLVDIQTDRVIMDFFSGKCSNVHLKLSLVHMIMILEQLDTHNVIRPSPCISPTIENRKMWLWIFRNAYQSEINLEIQVSQRERMDSLCIHLGPSLQTSLHLLGLDIGLDSSFGLSMQSDEYLPSLLFVSAIEIKSCEYLYTAMCSWQACQ